MKPNSTALKSNIRFGECAACFNALERPFWDTYCFDCQDSLDDIEEMAEVYDEPEELYG